VLLPPVLAILYFALAKWRVGMVSLMYDVPLPTLLAVYVPPCLLAVALLWPPVYRLCNTQEEREMRLVNMRPLGVSQEGAAAA
jgi:membrane protein implicated in regulation of membrane protease activity